MKDEETRKERTGRKYVSRSRLRPNIGDRIMTRNRTRTSKYSPVFWPDMMEVVELEENGVICEDTFGRKQRRHLDDVKISRGTSREDTNTGEQTVEEQELHVGEIHQQTQGVTQPKEMLKKSIRARRPNPKFADE